MGRGASVLRTARSSGVAPNSRQGPGNIGAPHPEQNLASSVSR